MKKLVLTAFGIIFLCSTAHAANVQRGYTYASNGEVTNTNLHQLVDDATVTSIDQDDAATNYGFTIRSGTAPTDTDALWYDTGNTVLKAYDGSSWEQILDTDPLEVEGDLIVSDDISAGGDISVDGGIWTNGHRVNSDFATPDERSVTTVYQAGENGFVSCNIIYNSGIDTEEWLTGYTDGNADPETVGGRCATGHVSSYQGWTRQGSFLMPVTKGNYYKVLDEGNDSPGTTAIYWIPFE